MISSAPRSGSGSGSRSLCAKNRLPHGWCHKAEFAFFTPTGTTPGLTPCSRKLRRLKLFAGRPYRVRDAEEVRRQSSGLNQKKEVENDSGANYHCLDATGAQNCKAVDTHQPVEKSAGLAIARLWESRA